MGLILSRTLLFYKDETLPSSVSKFSFGHMPVICKYTQQRWRDQRFNWEVLKNNEKQKTRHKNEWGKAVKKTNWAK